MTVKDPYQMMNELATADSVELSHPEIMSFAKELDEIIKRYEENSENAWKSKAFTGLYDEFKSTLSDLEYEIEEADQCLGDGDKAEYKEHLEQFEAGLYFLGIVSAYMLKKIPELKGDVQA